MRNKAVLKYLDVGVGKDQLLGLDDASLWALVAFAFAHNDLSVQMRSLRQSFQIPESPSLRRAWHVQHNVLMRSLSAKLFEVIETFSNISSSSKGFDDTVLKEFFKERGRQLRDLKKGRYYKLAEFCRNKMTNHYGIEEIKKNLSHWKGEDELKMLLARMHGNSLFPFAEDIVFYGWLQREFEGDKDGFGYEHLNEWGQWVQAVYRWHGTTLTELLVLLNQRLKKHRSVGLSSTRIQVSCFRLRTYFLSYTLAQRRRLMIRIFEKKKNRSIKRSYHVASFRLE